jgi:DNA-binding PadR family transcriptional regulator
MKPHAFQILLALSGGELHATGIVERVLEQTGGGVRLWPVTLHRTLDRLCEDGLIADLDERGEHPQGESRRRRYYRLTPQGAAALTEEAERLQALAATARDNLGKQRWRGP